MSEHDTTPNPGFFTRQRIIIIVIAVVVIIAVVIAIVATSSNSSTKNASSTSSPKPSASASTSTPDASASVTPSVPVPAPSPSVTRGAPGPIDKPAEIVAGVTAALTSIEAVKGVASTPGEVSGPAIRFVATITNSTAASVDLSGTVVTVYYGKNNTPGIQLEKPGGANLPASVAAGQTAQGTYVFTVPKSARSDVQIEIDYSVGVAPLFFRGAVPK